MKHVTPHAPTSLGYYSRSRPRADATLRVEYLLSRYPRLDEEEVEDLIQTFRSLRLIDIALIIADDRLGGKLESFHRDHGRRLEPSASGLLLLLAFAVVVVGGTWWWILG